MSNLDRSAVQRFQNEPWPWEKGVEDRAAVAGLPPGYITGFYPDITNGILTIGGGTAFIEGSRVDTDRRTIYESDCVVNWIGSATYYVYLNRGGRFSVDVVAPEYIDDYRYYGHPILNSRYIVGFTTDSNKDVSDFVMTIPNSAGVIAANAIGADLIQAGAINAEKIAADNFFFTKAVGSKSQDTPVSGDVRSYLGKDPAGAQGASDPVGLSIEEYNGEAYETRGKLAMRTGGNVADLFVSGFFQAGQAVLSSPGLIWDSSYSGGAGAISSVVESDSGVLTAVVQSSGLIQSLNNGSSWSALTSPASLWEKELLYDASGNLYLAADAVYKSTDDGSSWSALTNSPAGVIESIGKNGSRMVAVWRSGSTYAVAYTDDDGATSWTAATGASTSNARKIRHISGDTWGLVGASGTVARSDDNGETWTALSHSLGTDLIRDIETDGLVTVVVGDSGILGRSGDQLQTITAATHTFGTDTIFSVGIGAGVWLIATDSEVGRSENGALSFSVTAEGVNKNPSFPVAAGGIVDIMYAPVTRAFFLGGQDSLFSQLILKSPWLIAGSGIVEQGSNSNGNYVVFSSGLQVCWDRVSVAVTSVSDNAVGTYGWSFYQGTQAFTFAKPFGAAPIVVASPSETDATVSRAAGVYSVTTTGGSIIASNRVSGTDLIGYIAIGFA